MYMRFTISIYKVYSDNIDPNSALDNSSKVNIPVAIKFKSNVGSLVAVPCGYQIPWQQGRHRKIN